MEKPPDPVVKNSGETLLSPPAMKPIARVLLYLLRRLLAIGITIVVGVFLTVVIANHGGMLDKILKDRISRTIMVLNYQTNFQGDIEAERANLEKSSGLTLPFLPKHLLYTAKSLSLDWGNVLDHRKFFQYINTRNGQVATDDSRTIILSQLPNTLLLSGVAYLLLVLLGIPCALYLSQHEGKWLDKLAGVLTPLSSVPSWVLGILLVMVFAAELRWLPVSKMVDPLPPANAWQGALMVARHLVLPVTAIVLSMIFQLIFNWRTYLLIYSDEDYVTLARAKGVKQATLELRYILRPVLPYMLTSFVMTLVGFWQTITALEFFFQWPGIGKMFVDALPNFHGESMYAGEMTIVIGIVVIFAYLLGIAVFLLDLMYVIVDPRLQAIPQQETLKQFRKRFVVSIKKVFHRPTRPASDGPTTIFFSKKKAPAHSTYKEMSHNVSNTLKGLAAGTGRFMREISQMPAAMTGLVMVLLLVVISILVIIFIPYDPVGKNWSTGDLTGNPTQAKLALPVWVNWFRKDPLPSTIVLDTKSDPALKTITYGENDMPQEQIDFKVDYPFREFPSDMMLYLSSQYTAKKPFVMVTWITPDGREIPLKNATLTPQFSYNFDENVPFTQQVNANSHWQKWFIQSGNYRSPGLDVLFAAPDADTPIAQPGKYTLRLTVLLFEKDSSLDAQLVVFGKVAGWAGTDYLRRDLLVPLLWGLPFALFFGVIGAIATTVLSMIIAAASAWFGGWVDGLVQRITEANLILPVMAIGVLLYSYYNLNLWLILILIVLLNVLGSPTKAFRAAFLQEKQAAYIEAAQVYGASSWRIISSYLLPRILPAMIPQIVIMIPNIFFLEATLAIFNVSDPRYPTWGQVIYSALRYGASYGSQYWVLEPIAMMLITGLAFVLLGFSLNRMLNPQLKGV